MTEKKTMLHAYRCSTTNLTGIFQQFLATRPLIAHEKKGLGGHIGSVLPSDNSTINSASVQVALLSLCSLQETAQDTEIKQTPHNSFI